MRVDLRRWRNAVGAGAVAAGTIAAAAWGLPRFFKPPADEVADATPPPLTLVGEQRNGLALAPATRTRLGLQTAAAQTASSADVLRLSGWLFIDPARLVHVTARFPGEIVGLGTLGGAPGGRRLRVGDWVEPNQTLTQMWCREIGEKKSDMVDALSQLRLDERVLRRLQKLDAGAVAQRLLEEAERRVEADRIELNRAERTLRSWRLTSEEIAEVREEAEHLVDEGPRKESTDLRTWAEATVRSPIRGVILEQNVVPGDIVDTTIDLFKVADLSRLGVVVNAYEEDLPKLERLEPEARHWRVRLKADPTGAPREGRFELIGNLVDPNQHTATVVGWLDNADNKLRVGQFVTVEIDLPATEGEVVVPQQAVLEEGQRSYVFIASDRDGTEVTKRRISLRRIAGGMAYLRCEPTEAEQREGVHAIRLGELVVTSGAVELSGALSSLRSRTVASSPSGS